MHKAMNSIDQGPKQIQSGFSLFARLHKQKHWSWLTSGSKTAMQSLGITSDQELTVTERLQEMQQSAKNKEFAFSRLGPQPAWLAGGCCVQPQTDLNSLRVQQSHQSSSLLNNLTSRPSPSQLSLSPLLLSYPSHSPDWFPTSPHPAVSLLRDSPSVFIDLAAAAAAVRWQQQN